MPPAEAAGRPKDGSWSLVVRLLGFGHARKTPTKRREPPNNSNAD